MPFEDFVELLADDGPAPGRIGQDRLQLGDQGLQFGVLVPQLGGLERGEPAQRHVEDGLRLHLGELEALHQRRAGGVGVLGGADDLDHLVDVVDGDEEAFEDVGPRLGLLEPELGAPLDDLHLMVEVVLDHLGDVERARHAVHQRHVVHAERVLQLGELVELIEDHLGHGIPLQLDDEAGAHLRGGLVAQVGDPGQLLVVDQLGDLLQHPILADLIGQLGDHDGSAALADLLHVGDGSHLDRAAAGEERVLDAPGADDVGAGRKVGTLHDLEVLLGTRIGILQTEETGLHDLAEVVGRDVGGHTHRDPLRAVDQQVREARGQHRRLAVLAVVVVLEVDRVLVDPVEERHGQLLQPALGVPHGGRRIVDGAEVALGIDERIPQREVLAHPHQGVVDGVVGVRVELADHLTDHGGALAVGAVGPHAHVVHRIEDAALDGLQTVAHIGQRPRHDDGHRVVHERTRHLLVDVDRLELLCSLVGGDVVGHLGSLLVVRSLRCPRTGRPWRSAG